jgi:Protein of unknown function (DUF2865)
MPRKPPPTALEAVLVALAALLVALPIAPAGAQSFLQSIFGKNAPPAKGYGRSQESVFSPYGGLFSPYQPSQRFDTLPPPDRTTYRTLCVRMCDGFYFPISFSTTSGSFTRDAEKCSASCGEDARLFYYPNPGGDVDSMVDLTGRAYGSYPMAFRYRKTLVKGCQCRPQPWSEAERARHRAYAAAQSPAAENTDPNAPTVGKAPAQVAGYQQDIVAGPAPIDRADLASPYEQAAVPPLMPAKSNLSPMARPNPISRQKQAEQWNWFAGNPAMGHARPSYSFPSAR